MSEISKDNQQFYRLCFRDIIAGFSFFSFKKNNFYLKHLSELDLADIEYEAKVFEIEGKSKKLQTEKEKIKFLYDSGNWDIEEGKLITLKNEINDLNKKVLKIFIKSQKKEIEKRLVKAKKEYEKLKEERDNLLGITLEVYVEKKKLENLLRVSLYKEKELINLVYTREEYEDLEDEVYSDLIREYNVFMIRFSEENLKKVAVCPFFLNSFFLAKDSVFEFYGKRILDLTFYQHHLFSRGIFCKNVLSQPDKHIPDELYDDLDKLVNWFEVASLTNDNMPKNSKNENNAMALVGATKEELEQVALSQGARVINMAEEVKKMKKELGKDQLSPMDVLKMHQRLGI